MNICVIGGAGYVGIVTGVCLSEAGHNVIAIDVDEARIQSLQEGHCPIYEEGIEPLLQKNIQKGRLSFTTDLRPAVEASEVVFIAVGTPSGADGQEDLSQFTSVTADLAACLDSYKVLAIRSTVTLAAVDLIREVLGRKAKEGQDFDIVANPEFLREGKGVRDFLFPDRIVIGTDSERAKAKVREVYDPIVKGKVSWVGFEPDPGRPLPIPVIETTLPAAQMIKYASNAFLASRISFINEVAGLCEKIGADVVDVIQGMGHDPRIGHAHLSPGPGFGGPCLEKDLRALISLSENNGHQPYVLRAVLERNECQVADVVGKLQKLSGESLDGKTVAVLGLAFKADTDDTRNSPAIKAIEILRAEGALVRAHDPVATKQCLPSDPGVTFWEDPYEAVRGANGVIIMTEWPVFREMDFTRVKSEMATPCIVDSRNLLDAEQITALGFKYLGIGRK